MLIRCCFAIIRMVDTIYFASSRSSFQFHSTIGTVHHVFLQHLDFYLDHATLFLIQVLGGGIHEIFILASSCALYIYIYMCMYLFLVDQFLPLIDFSLFVQQSLLWIYTLTTPNMTTLHIMTTIILVYMASYMTTGCGHANHAFSVNVCSQG